MNNFDIIKSKNIDELVEWLDEYMMVDNTPWYLWFDKNYCSKCPSEVVYYESDRGKIPIECAWCELEHKCKFLPELDKEPDSKQIIKMWLETDN